ncbi:hypothetical protein H6G17_23210 [Chroococcidiopsis sp. FACHB-1243]|uniref:hypothetical protein n=1 Tax=Chroococcidiopsis sp. [FACHB-1243] TaxID=2692781 RepID=UPI00177D9E84|nr:hypothetical protein [Chroococcidiopsis sp. [FACHB-1243]]MBD2308389.1 hypothetical protein [Chroococcidiopsis sp. [FACHB-1243]]
MRGVEGQGGQGGQGEQVGFRCNNHPLPITHYPLPTTNYQLPHAIFIYRVNKIL